MSYAAIIFDVGDTLLKHSPSESQIYIDRLKRLGFDIHKELAASVADAITAAAHEQIEREQNGAPRMSDEDFVAMQDKAAISCVDAGKSEGDLLKALSHIPIAKQELTIIPGAIEVLQALKDKGFRLGIVSNHHAWLPAFLTKIGLSDFFETIVVSDIVGFEKPDARIMEIALKNLSLAACECLYVGDHPFDVLCAKNAGVDCAWLTALGSTLPKTIPYKEDYRINKLQDLLKLF